jgi:hypothetical protein
MMSAVAEMDAGTRPTLFDEAAVEAATSVAPHDGAGLHTGAFSTPRDGAGGEPGLDEMIVHLWEGLTAHRLVACPACGSDMRPQYGVHALPIGGGCGHCGSTLS